MGGWTFQLQQDGDEAWLPLESPDVEILEGRYRLIGRGPIDVLVLNLRITYLPLGEPELSRRGMNRSVTADPQLGYMLLPLIYLQPGEWELRLEQGSTLKLQVLPREASGLSEPIWESSEGSTAPSPDPPPFKDLFQESGYTLLLRQDQFQVNPGDMLTLAGEIRSSQAVRNSQSSSMLSLRIVLSHPNGQLVLDQYKALDLDSWPLTFQIPLRLPSHLSEGRLNGELSLHHSLAPGTPLAAADLNIEVHCPASAMQWMIAPEANAGNPEPPPEPASPLATSPEPLTESFAPPEAESDAEDDLDLGDRLFRRLRDIVLAAQEAAPSAESTPVNDSNPPPSPNPLVPHQLPQRGPQPAAGVRPLDPAPVNLVRQEEQVNWDPEVNFPPARPEVADQSPIPEPQLHLPLDACQPGTRVPLEFRLPRTARRLAVKWWLQDACNQKRWGGFRLVLDFAPCSEHELLALTEVPLPPQGCTWTLEAIAFDLLSQQESRAVQLALPMPASCDLDPD